MATFTIVASVVGGDVQNVQELSATFGEIRTKIGRLDGVRCPV